MQRQFVAPRAKKAKGRNEEPSKRLKAKRKETAAKAQQVQVKFIRISYLQFLISKILCHIQWCRMMSKNTFRFLLSSFSLSWTESSFQERSVVMSWSEMELRMPWESRIGYRERSGNQVSRLCNYSPFELLLPLHWAFENCVLKNWVPGAGFMRGNWETKTVGDDWERFRAGGLKVISLYSLGMRRWACADRKIACNPSNKKSMRWWAVLIVRPTDTYLLRFLRLECRTFRNLLLGLFLLNHLLFCLLGWPFLIASHHLRERGKVVTTNYRLLIQMRFSASRKAPN